MKVEKNELKNAIQLYVNECIYGYEWAPKKGYKEKRLGTPDKFNLGLTQGHSVVIGKTLYFIIRGSDEKGDWWGPFGNFAFKKITYKVDTAVKVAEGWYSTYKRDIKKYLFALINNRKKRLNKIVIVTHSRGGPLGMYAAENVKFYNPKLIVKGIYFASPRPGNKAFRELHDKSVDASIMYYVIGDIVCAVPLLSFGYRQIKNTKGYFAFGIPHYPHNIFRRIKAKEKL